MFEYLDSGILSIPLIIDVSFASIGYPLSEVPILSNNNCNERLINKLYLFFCLQSFLRYLSIPFGKTKLLA